MRLRRPQPEGVTGFFWSPTIAVLALGQPEKATPASGPAGWGLPEVSRRSPVPGLWGILTALINERKQVGRNVTAGKNQGNTKKILNRFPTRCPCPPGTHRSDPWPGS